MVLCVLSLVIRFIKNCRARKLKPASPVQQDGLVTPPQPEELNEARLYFFRLATREVHQFTRVKDYKDCSEVRDGERYFVGRLLNSREVHAMEAVMFDLNPLSFCLPVVD